MTVARLGDEMPSDEFARWLAWTELHGPLGPERGDIQAAQVCSWLSAVACAWGGGKPYPISDLLLDWSAGKEKAKQRQAEKINPDEGMDSWAKALLMIERNRLQAERDRKAKGG